MQFKGGLWIYEDLFVLQFHSSLIPSRYAHYLLYRLQYPPIALKSVIA